MNILLLFIFDKFKRKKHFRLLISVGHDGDCGVVAAFLIVS
jgi:hypothetical protein